jgi:hypothetical protein
VKLCQYRKFFTCKIIIKKHVVIGFWGLISTRYLTWIADLAGLFKFQINESGSSSVIYGQDYNNTYCAHSRNNKQSVRPVFGGTAIERSTLGGYR